MTGPTPTDRGKLGTTRHVLTDSDNGDESSGSLSPSTTNTPGSINHGGFSAGYNWGNAENEKEIEKMVDKIMKKHSSLIETDPEVIPIENIKEYTNEVVAEVKNSKNIRDED